MPRLTRGSTEDLGNAKTFPYQSALRAGIYACGMAAIKKWALAPEGLGFPVKPKPALELARMHERGFLQTIADLKTSGRESRERTRTIDSRLSRSFAANSFYLRPCKILRLTK